MQVTYTQTSEELRRRFLPPTRFRERLAMLGTPLLFFAAACQAGVGKASLWVAVAALYGVVVALFWIVTKCLARKDVSTDYLVEINELDFSVKAVDSPERRHPWAHVGNVADEGDYIVFTSNRGQNLAVVPQSAFADSHAKAFFEQSRRYWETAKEKQRDEAQRAEGSWPPPPHTGA